MNLEKMNRELLEEVTSLKSQNLNLSKKNKELKKQLTIPNVSNCATCSGCNQPKSTVNRYMFDGMCTDCTPKAVKSWMQISELKKKVGL